MRIGRGDSDGGGDAAATAAAAAAAACAGCLEDGEKGAVCYLRHAAVFLFELLDGSV